MINNDAELGRFYEAYKRIVWPFHYLLPRRLRQTLNNYGSCGAYQVGLSLYDYAPKGNGFWQRVLRWLFPMLTEFEQSDFYKNMKQLYGAEVLKKTTASDYAHNVQNEVLYAYLTHINRSDFVEILLLLKEKNIFPDQENEREFLDKICHSTQCRVWNRDAGVENAKLKRMKMCLITMDTLGLFVDRAEGMKNFELMLEHTNPIELLNICLLLIEVLKEENSQNLRQTIFTILSKHTFLDPASGNLLEQVGHDRYSRLSLYDLLKQASQKSFMSFQLLLMIAKSPAPVTIFNALFLLDKASLISHPAIVKNLPHILEHKDPIDLVETLVRLFGWIPHADDYIQLIIKCSNPHDMAHALLVLIEAGMVNESTWTIYIKELLHSDYKENRIFRRNMAHGMHNLEKHGMLNQRNVDFIAGDSAISYSNLLIELNKSGLFQPQNADYYLNMLENHKNPLSLTRALILRELYKERFTHDDNVEIRDDKLMACYHAAFQVQWIALKRFLNAFEDYSKEINNFIVKIDEQSYIPLSYAPLNNLFRLDRKGQLALKGESLILALLKNINQNIDSWENDLSDPEPESDADFDDETDRFFNIKWHWSGLSIFDKKEFARHQFNIEQQIITVKHSNK